MNFKKLNNLVGWLMFAIAAIVYLSSMERELSFWDCGEYIVSSAKLGVTHAPGAATFQLLGAVWSSLAMGNGNNFPILINALSALSSAFTILFLFWTITHFCRRIIYHKKHREPQGAHKWICLMSGAVGALAFTFSDSFWFSAVEGEVYAMASMFTALLLWLACKWENAAGQPRENRWLVLISLLIGLSTGVHLMAILTVPAICYLYYFRHYKFTWKSFIIANAITIAIFVFVFKIVFSFTMTFLGNTEIFMVNQLGMPFHSGSITALLIILCVFAFGFYFTQKKKKSTANTIILSVFFMLIGFSSWLMIPIRANANPHLNLNDPDSAIGLLSYFNREQYGDWPIFRGPLYTAHLDPDGIEKNADGSYKMKDDGPIYKRNEAKGIYEVVGRKKSYVYNEDQIGWFARMHDPSFAKNYEALMGPAETYKSFDLSGREVTHYKKPGFFKNIEFFLRYQIGYMYLRYLGWNFVGRQNDFQGNMEVTKGNTITGINFIDNILVGGAQENLPTEFKDNKARNVYFAIPFILGLIGFFFQLQRDWGRNFAMISLFLLTGVGILIYTNVKPFEPRERDYAVVSSFYVFSIWIGLSLLAIYQFAEEHISPKPALAISALTFIAPALMGTQNWDDHTRADREAAHDLAYNYLANLDKNAILFVYGDNDTYPLWALQETSMFRPDIKIENFTLLASSWNIAQAKRKTYDAAPLPSQLTMQEYKEGKNEAIVLLSKNLFGQLYQYAKESHVTELLNSLNRLEGYNHNGMKAKDAVNFLQQSTPEKEILLNTLKQLYSDEIDNVLPTNTFIVPVDKDNAIKHGIVAKNKANRMVSEIVISLPKNQISYKNELLMLDLLANYNWDRSLYFSSGGIYDEANIFYLGNYLEYDGFSYKFVPILTEKSETGEMGGIDADSMYKQILNFRWANFNNPNAYFDETCRQNILTYRNAVARTVGALLDKGEKQKAKKLLALSEEKIPYRLFSEGISLYNYVPLYFKLGENQKGKELYTFLNQKINEKIQYYSALSPIDMASVFNEYQRTLSEQQFFVGQWIDYLLSYKKDTLQAKKDFVAYYNSLEKRILKLSTKAKTEGLPNLSDIETEVLSTDLSLQRNMLNLASEIDSVYAKQKFNEMVTMLNAIDPREKK